MNRVRTRPEQEAWFVQGPGPDERLGSVVNRAGELYGTTGESLLSELLGQPRTSWSGIDGASAAQVTEIARALKVAPRELWRHRLPDHPRLLAPNARQAYCPACWREDRAAGREPGFRRAWASLLRTRCEQHAEPLHLAGPFSYGNATRSVRDDDRAGIEDRQACIDAIESFGHTLEGALFFGRPWPRTWRLSPWIARALLPAVSLNLGRDEQFPAISLLVCTAPLAGIVRVPTHALSPLHQTPWEAFREIADPAARRAALWLVGWRTCPDWPEAWRPGWVERDFDVTDYLARWVRAPDLGRPGQGMRAGPLTTGRRVPSGPRADASRVGATALGGPFRGYSSWPSDQMPAPRL